MGFYPGRPQGQMKALESDSIRAIREHLDGRTDALAARDRALFAMALDSCLRGCDLLALCVGDVLDHTGAVRSTIVARQKKLSSVKCRPVRCYLTPRTCSLLAAHVAGQDRSEPLFCGKGRSKPLTPQTLRARAHHR